MKTVEPEIITQDDEDQSERRLKGVRFLGLAGTALALLTMLAAFGFGLLALFGTTLLSAVVVAILWPWIFSPQFTQWVFGTPSVPFWKLFLLMLAVGAVFKFLRRSHG